MSILSSVTGIGINPFGKRKLKIDPLKALGTVATVGSFGGLGPLAAGLSHIPGGAAALGAAGKIAAGAKALPGAAKVGGAISGIQRLLGSGGGGGGGVPPVTRNGQPITLSDINPNIPRDPAGAGGDGGGTDWLGLAEGGLAGLSAFNAAKQSGQAGKYQDAALAQANARWGQGAPLRAAAVPRLLNPARPDLTQVFNDPTNAFARPAAPNSASPAGLRRRMVS